MIDSATQLYGVFGNPVSHSMGPLMHNAAFTEKGINAVYLAFHVKDIKKGIDSIKALGITGVSVTIPFKQSVFPFLDEIDALALEIGAVNTIVNKNGILAGFNTDSHGAVEPLKRKCRIKNKRICILGAGGAARAVAFGIRKENGIIFIGNRSEKRGKSLAKQTGGKFVSPDNIGEVDPDIIINATPVGMTPYVNESPIAADLLKDHMTVMDIVYNPLRTKLIEDAQNAGCTVIDGLSMFVNQGAAQFELFTGVKAPMDLMAQTVLDNINDHGNK